MKHPTLWAIIALAGCGRSDAGFESLRALGGVFGVPNIDDDDGNDRRDFLDVGPEGDNDRAILVLASLVDGMRASDVLELELSGTLADLRVWSQGEVLLDEAGPSVELTAEQIPDSVDVEFRTFLSEGALAVRQRDRSGELVDAVELRLLAAPLILNHHLQPVEATYVVEGVDGGYGIDNTAMIGDLRAVLGGAVVVGDMDRFGFDVWVQDEFETATLTAPDGRIDLVIDSIRDRGLDPFPERLVATGPDSAVRTWGNGAYPTSQDSFGNLEVSPPVTVDGVAYPFGRIYYGAWRRNGGLVGPLDQLLRRQRVQAPFVLDVSWLCVGHVDEFSTFIPDPSAPKGFRMFVSDTGEGLALLDGLDPDLALPRYTRAFGYATVGQMAGDVALRALNEDLQVDWIEPAVDQLKQELGLTEADLVRVPGLFEEAMGCGPYAAALIPGTVNMLVATDDAGHATLILPDPFLRSTPDQGTDPLIQAVNALLPPTATPVWVDDWDTYHVALGEVHCGTNTTRTPTAQWWTDALHLIDGDGP